MSDSNAINGSKYSNILVHPLFLVFATAILGGIGFLMNKYFFTEQSDFRFLAQNIEQYEVLAEDQPTFDDSNIYCGTFRMRLLLAHNGKGQQNVTIHRISAKIDPPTKPIPKPACIPDPLAGKPAGVIGTESIKVDFDGSNITARRFVSRTDSRQISPENLLADSDSARAITLKPNEESVSFDVFVSSRVDDVREVFFEAVYDLNGEKTIQTGKVLLAGQP